MMSKPSSILNSTQSGPADQSVAVIMTCYNEGRYIGEAVRSVLSQTAQGQIHEIVIADDGSEPETIAVLKDIEQWDPRILVLYGEGGKGLPAQRNLAIANSTAGYLAILDGDDLWEAAKLEKQLFALARSVDIGLVYSDFFTFHDTSIETARRAGVLDITDQTELKIAYFLNDPPIIPSTILITRKSYVASGGFDANVRVFEDTDFFIRMAAVCKFGLVNEPLLYKRNRSTSITGGRKDLMAHHAFVAFKAASTDMRLMSLVPKRLSERSRKLGNQRFLLGDIVEARQHLLLAVQLNPFNRRAWFAYIAVRFFPQIATMVRKRDVDARRTALGV